MSDMELKLPREIYCCIIIACPNLFHVPISKGSLLNSYSYKNQLKLTLSPIGLQWSQWRNVWQSWLYCVGEQTSKSDWNFHREHHQCLLRTILHINRTKWSVCNSFSSCQKTIKDRLHSNLLFLAPPNANLGLSNQYMYVSIPKVNFNFHKQKENKGQTKIL